MQLASKRAKRRFLFSAALLATAIVSIGTAQAQDGAGKPITILVPQTAGTIQDLVARSLGDEMAKLFKQTVLVDNRPGASQVIGSTALARAAPDGTTLMVSAMPNAIAPKVLATLPYAGNQHFTVIAYSLSVATILAASPQVPANNLKEFVALLKANPGKYMYGSAGVGTPMHMFLEQFNRDAGTQSTHIPYKAYQDIIRDVATNTVQYSFLPVTQMQFVKQGRMKAIGIVGPTRDAQYPELATLDEQGLKGFDGSIHYFVIGPKGLPAEIVARVNEAVNAIQSREAHQAKFRGIGGVTVPQNVTPAAAAELYKRDDERFLPLIKDGTITFE